MGKRKYYKIKIKECKKYECSTHQKITLTSLTFRGDSGMRTVWHDISAQGHCEYDIIDHRIFIAYLKNKIIGWSIAYKERNNKFYAMFYVSKRYRRMGVGSALLGEARNFANKFKKKIYVFDECPQFFESCGIKTRNRI